MQEIRSILISLPSWRIKLLTLSFLAASTGNANAELSESLIIIGRISDYSVVNKQERSFKPELMFGAFGALIGHGLRGGQPDIAQDYRIYDIQTEVDSIFRVASRQEFERTSCVEVKTLKPDTLNNFAGLGDATMREVDTCSDLKPILPISADEIKEKPGRPN